MYEDNLQIGQINYLNIWPIFYFLRNTPNLQTKGMDFLEGHPSELNMLLRQGKVDLAPASLFEYLENAELYHLLPNNGISASREVQSVILCTPVHGKDLEKHIRNKGKVSITSASATSVALLKILWRFAWDLPLPQWVHSPPGKGEETGLPFLEIGNFALETYFSPPKGYVVFDLAREWKKFTGLPFVFAVWIARRGLSEEKNYKLRQLYMELERIKSNFPHEFASIVDKRPPGQFTSEQLLEYWQTMHFNLFPENLAAMAIFALYCSKLGLIEGAPVLSWKS